MSSSGWRSPGAPAAALLCLVHDDDQVRALLAGDLRDRFGGHYEVEAHAEAESGMRALERHAADGRRVAAVFSGNNAACGGEDFRARVRDLHADARRVLLVGRGEWSKRHPAVAAMRTGNAEAYIFVPWALRERWLYLPVSEILADWEASQRPATEAVQVIGEEWEPRAHSLRELFFRIGVPMGFYRMQSPEAQRILEEAGIDADAWPVLKFATGAVLVDPSHERIATQLGFSTEPESKDCDLAIVGAGPAGLAAAVYGASEGLATTVIDDAVPGGQAGTSSRIRNYLGFPTGISGRDLTSRALEQAWFFGARFILSKRVTAIVPAGEHYTIKLGRGCGITASTVIIASGVTWRRLKIPSLEALHGVGVFYGAAASDAISTEGADVYIVGAGNSAGQAAVHLARSAGTVTLLVRGERLAASMSDYLVRQLEQVPNIRIRVRTEVIDGSGTGRLTGLTLRDAAQGITEHVRADALYVMIGARPHTDWLSGTLARDDEGYILTGTDLTAHDGRDAAPWPLRRPPMLLETSLPGLFAAGDVRHGSVKRVASAVGNGSIAVQLAHLRLAELS
jgi:thioredoxin reductase (NADPH)